MWNTSFGTIFDRIFKLLIFFVFYLIYYRHFTCRILSSSLSYIEICIRRFHASEIQYQLAAFKMCTNVLVFRFRREKNRKKFFRIKSWKQSERSTKNKYLLDTVLTTFTKLLQYSLSLSMGHTWCQNFTISKVTNKQTN